LGFAFASDGSFWATAIDLSGKEVGKMTMMKSLSHHWESEGYVTSLDVLTESEVRHYRSLFDELESKEGKSSAQIGLIDRHFKEKFVWELATHPVILKHVQCLIGPDVLLLATHFFCKYPSLGDKFVAWHQDVTYWGLEPPFAITAWLAIDDADQENGCMRVIPGSHLGDILDHGKSSKAGNLLSVNQEIPDAMVSAASAVDIVLKAGQMSLHHGKLIHGSNPNRSHRRRCGLTIRFVPPSIKPVDNNSTRGSWHTILVCGKDEYRHFKLEPRPCFSL
jgi:non-heme Fe2+,alpha-ketoglutarate-dependent halogenase